jgi:hypothetical protein
MTGHHSSPTISAANAKISAAKHKSGLIKILAVEYVADFSKSGRKVNEPFGCVFFT